MNGTMAYVLQQNKKKKFPFRSVAAAAAGQNCGK
jgi:homoserine dehydrogenase